MREQSSEPLTINLEKVTEHVEKLKEKYNNKTEVSKEIQHTTKVLASCNEVLQDRMILPDPVMTKNMHNLLKALTNLKPLNNDKALQEKVNALQTGLFGVYLSELKKLEENLQSDKWKIGQKVKNTDKSKSSS